MKKKDDELSCATTKRNVVKCKIVLVGDQYVGKTSIINRFIKNEFDQSHNATIGIDFVSKNIIAGDTTIRLQLWDTAGQERFRSLIPNYLRDSQTAFVVYDLTNKESFQAVPRWVDFIKEARGEDVCIFAIGNKTDMIGERVVEQRVIIETFNKLGIKHFEVSAKLGDGLQNLFQKTCEELVGFPDKCLSIKASPIESALVPKQPLNPDMTKSYKLTNVKTQQRRITDNNCC